MIPIVLATLSSYFMLIETSADHKVFYNIIDEKFVLTVIIVSAVYVLVGIFELRRAQIALDCVAALGISILIFEVLLFLWVSGFLIFFTVKLITLALFSTLTIVLVHRFVNARFNGIQMDLERRK